MNTEIEIFSYLNGEWQNVKTVHDQVQAALHIKLEGLRKEATFWEVTPKGHKFHFEVFWDYDEKDSDWVKCPPGRPMDNRRRQALCYH